MSSPTAFHPFPSLPPEIRHRIYNYALNLPHIVQLYLKRTPLTTPLEPDLHRLVALSSRAIHPLTGPLNNLNPSITTICLRPHALLSVNNESRGLSLNHFTSAFQNRAFVNPESDTFYLQDTSAFRLAYSINTRTKTQIPPRLAAAEIASRIQYLALPLSSLFPDGSQHLGPEQTVKALSKMAELREVLVVFYVKEDEPGSHQGVKFLEVSSRDFERDGRGDIVPTREVWGVEVGSAVVKNAEIMVERFLVLLGREMGGKEPGFKVVMARVPWKAKS
jgi:hypothetical protein